MIARDDRIRNLVAQAMVVLAKADTPTSLWRAYVGVEYAILDVKLRYGLENEKSPPAPKRTVKRDELLSLARQKLSGIDFEDKKDLLRELRECRNALKALLAKP